MQGNGFSMLKRQPGYFLRQQFKLGKLEYTLAVFLIAVLLFSLYEKHAFLRRYTPSNQTVAAKILIMWHFGISESEFIERIKITGRKLNPPLDVRVISSLTKPRLQFTRSDYIDVAIKQFKPDFILALHGIDPKPGAPNYITFTSAEEVFVNTDQNGKPQLIDARMHDFDAILSAYKNISNLKAAYESKGKKLKHFPWYVTSHATNYPPAMPYRLFYSGGTPWDTTTRGSEKYKKIFSLLDQTGYFLVSGPKYKWRHTPSSLIGLLPIDGTSLINYTNKAGIALVLHSKIHLAGGVPTGRIFEAVSANVAIITDKHPFIIEHFGDNVLYIDVEQDADNVFQQIDTHVQWILTHPQAAQRMAQRCHQIYQQKFSLEVQLTDLVAMHKQWEQEKITANTPGLSKKTKINI